MTSVPVTSPYWAEPAGAVPGVPRVGCDLQQVAPVARALAQHGQRYLRTLFAAEEIADLTAPPAAESVAGRFAAKEAVLKVLRPGAHDAVAWPHILIRSNAHGAPHVELQGTAARLAREAGLGSWSVSVSHDGGFAMAVAVALATHPSRP